MTSELTILVVLIFSETMNKTKKKQSFVCVKNLSTVLIKRLDLALPCDVIILKMKQNILFEINIIKKNLS